MRTVVMIFIVPLSDNIASGCRTFRIMATSPAQPSLESMPNSPLAHKCIALPMFDLGVGNRTDMNFVGTIGEAQGTT